MTWLLSAAMLSLALMLPLTSARRGSRHHRWHRRTATFNLTAQPAYLNQPDGSTVYSWGYGCNGAPSGFAPVAIKNRQLYVDAGSRPHADRHRRTDGRGDSDEQSPHLGRQHLDPLSRLPGDADRRRCRPADTGGGARRHGDLHLHRLSPGTRAYYSGTQGDLQVEMGLYGAVIVLPATVPTNCTTGLAAANLLRAKAHWGESDFRLVARPPTTTPRPATTGNTCSSSPRWTPTSTSRHWPR